MELNKEVLNAFSIKPKNIRKFKGIYIVDTNNMSYKIRLLSVSENKIIESQKIVKYLKQHNLKTIDEYKLTDSGMPYFIYRGETYVVSNNLQLRKNDFGKKDDLLKMTNFLASFHKALKTTDIEIYPQKNIINVYKDNLKQLKNIKKRLSKNLNYNDFDMNFIKSSSIYFDLIENTIFNIDTEYYRTRLLVNTSNKTIAHNNIKEENFETYFNEIYVNNFMKIDVSDQLIDIALLIQRHLKVKVSNEVVFYDIINEYLKHANISDEDINIIKAIATFPKKYVKTVLTYYEKNRKWTPTGLFNKLNNEIENQNQNNYFYENIK